jgi:putative nucleotidyltransferase with HDIG domain
MQLQQAVPTRKRINVEQIEVGMYCEDVYNEDDVFILSASIPISSLEQISILKRLGVKTVEIDTAKGKDVGGDGRVVSTASEVTRPSSDQSLAREVYGRTIETVRYTLQTLKLGRDFPAQELEEMAEDVVGSIQHNADVLMGLTQVKSFGEDIFEHSVNVAILSCSLAHALGYERDVLKDVCIGGLLHDIGKTWVPEQIVKKPSRLTDAEYAVMKRHPDYGLEILKSRKGVAELSKTIIIQHHERIGGQGYPRGLKGNQIHPLGLVAGISDAYEAMTSPRVYRRAMTPQLALATLYNGIDSEFPRLVSERFIKLLGVYPIGSFVRLAGGEMGIVTKVNKYEFFAPEILIIFAKEGEKLLEPKYCRLSEKVNKPGGERFTIEKSLDPGDYGIDVADFLRGNYSVS